MKAIENQYYGTSSERSDVGTPNSVFYETDTGAIYLYGPDGRVHGNSTGSSPFYAGGGKRIINEVEITQAEYDALGTPDPNTWYRING